MTTTDQLSDEATRDRAIRLFTYLKELCALRSSQVRNLAAYDQVFWFNELPHAKQCQCIAWRSEGAHLHVSEQDPDLWVSHHADVTADFYESRIARHPRRTGEAWAASHLFGMWEDGHPLPKDADFPELWKWFAELAMHEKGGVQ